MKVAVQNLQDLKDRHKRCKMFIVMIRALRILKSLKRDLDERVKKHTQQCRLNYYASKIQHKYLRYHIRTYSFCDINSVSSGSKDKLSLIASNRKMVNKLRNSLNIYTLLKHEQASSMASQTILKFLTAFHRMQNWKR